MENICRVCRHEDNSATLVEIFTFTKVAPAQHQEPPNSLAYMLNHCSNGQVKRGDSLPQRICLSCAQATENAFKFKVKCEESYQHFCQFLAQVELDDGDMDINSIKIETEQIQEEEQQKFLPEHQKSHVCETCGKDFKRRCDLTAHIRMHTGERPFKCPHCTQSYTQGHNLKKHLRNHCKMQPEYQKVKLYRCDACPALFRERYRVRLHKQNKHGPKKEGNLQTVKPNETPIKLEPQETDTPPEPPAVEESSKKSHFCQLCPSSFHQKFLLARHLRSHHGEQPFKCPHCPNAYTRDHNLKIHLRQHTGERPYQCPRCPKSYPRLTNLNIHMRKHD